MFLDDSRNPEKFVNEFHALHLGDRVSKSCQDEIVEAFKSLKRELSMKINITKVILAACWSIWSNSALD